jgi:sigma-70-like protein
MRRERRLRRAVARYGSCLSRLPARQERVLALRVGLHGAPHSRRSVARMTGYSVKRVRRLEHAGVKRLVRMGHHGGCGPATSTSAASAFAGGVDAGAGTGTGLFSTAAAVTGALPPLLADVGPSSWSRLRSTLSDAVAPGRTAIAASRSPSGDGNSFDLPLLLILGIEFAALAFALREVLRHRRAT